MKYSEFYELIDEEEFIEVLSALRTENAGREIKIVINYNNDGLLFISSSGLIFNVMGCYGFIFLSAEEKFNIIEHAVTITKKIFTKIMVCTDELL